MTSNYIINWLLIVQYDRFHASTIFGSQAAGPLDDFFPDDFGDGDMHVV